MPTVATRYEHIVLDAQGVPWISGTRMKVIELVLDNRAYGWSPEELRFQHPHLSMGQIYSALAYYEDHRKELDNDIERRLRLVDQARLHENPTPLEKRLRSHGLI
jgi:uncharacterized protein (DUF433 family)